MTDQIEISLDMASPRIDHKVIMVDAALAARWLTKNTRNRKVRAAVVQRYRTDMEHGR